MTDPAPVPPSPAEQRPTTDSDPGAPATTTRCRWQVLVIAVVFALVIAAGAPWLADWLATNKGAPVLFGGYLPMLPIALVLLIALVWNPLMKLGAVGRLVVRPWELMAVVALLFAATGVAGRGLQETWTNALLVRPAMEGSASKKPIATAIPEQLTVPFKAEDPEVARLVDGMRTGAPTKPLPEDAGALARARQRLGEAGDHIANLPLAPLRKPIAWTSALAICGIVLILGLGAMTARQWTHHERLQHPLAQVPLALSDSSILRSRVFWIGFGAVMLLWLWNLMVGWGWNPLPRIATDIKVPGVYQKLGMGAPGSAEWLLRDYWSTINIFPIAIGIAFLLTLDLGFSVWGGFWIGVALFGWLYTAGVPVSYDVHGRLVGSGATLAMAGLILVIGRHHYWALLKAAVGAGRDQRDRAGVWGVRAVILAALGIFTLVWWIGGRTGASASGALLCVLLVGCYVLVIARVVAECGLANFQSAHEMALVANSLGLPVLLPYQVLMAMLWLGHTLVADTRENTSGYVVQGAAVSERQGLRSGRMWLAMGAIAVVAALIAGASGLLSNWVQGTGAPTDRAAQPDKIIALVDQATLYAGGASAFWWDTMLTSPVLIGIGLLLLVALGRRLWVGFPFNPLGLVVATSWPVFVLWGSLMLGWLAKLLVLRYGGVQLYKKLKPLAYGVILGDIAGYFVQFMVFTIGKMNDQQLDIWRNLP